MTASDFRVGRQQRRKLAPAEQPGELTAVARSPRGTPVLKEHPGVRLDGEPSVGRGHGPMLANPNMLGNELDLVGFIANVLDDGIRDNQVECSIVEGQMATVGDDEVLPRDRVFGSPVELLEENSARHEHVNGIRHAVGDDVLERLILTGLCANNEHTAGANRTDDGFEPIRLAVAVEDAESTGSSRNERAHSRSLWQAIAAKPMLVAVVALAMLFASACTAVSTQEASLQALPTPQSPAAGQQDGADADATTEVQSDTDRAADDSGQPESPVATVTDELSAGAQGSAGSASDRGSRTGADDVPAEPTTPQDPPENATAGGDSSGETAEDTTDPNESPTPTSDGDAGTPTAVPTTAPLTTAEPVATTAPLATAAPQPTATPVPTAVPTPIPPSADPDAAFTAPAPTGPVPSDDIVVQGPDVDESERVDISAEGAAACAAAESAIDLLDRGDRSGTAAALQQAAEFAAQASEPEITGVASQLAAAGEDEEAAITAIIATLNACAVHGYQV